MFIEKKYHKESAFSLVELAIVITIAGILFAAVTGSQSIAHNARINKVIISLKEIDQAIESFKTTYKGIPRDFARATSYFSGTANGDGDGQIEDRKTVSGNVRESLRAWQHLSLANVIKGNYTGTGSSLKGGINIPGTDLDGISMNFTYDFWHSTSAWTEDSYLENSINIGIV